MYVTNGQEDARKSEILALMPASLRKHMYKINFDGAIEIRLSIGRSISVTFGDGRYYLSKTGYLTKSNKGSIKANHHCIEEALEIATKSSLYNCQQSICEGFITASGGHRIGLAGSGVYEKDSLVFMRDISTLSYRLASSCEGVAQALAKSVCQNDIIKNTLIISPPCQGKTTMLRDLVRILSKEGHKICVADERGEIAAMHNGESAFDIGENTDVIDMIPKSVAMNMALRALSPRVIAVDELGGCDDAEAITNCIAGGVSVLATAHAESIEQLQLRTYAKECVDMFEVFAILKRDTKTGEFNCSIIRREEL